MELTAAYHDGLVSLVRAVTCRFEGNDGAVSVVILDPQTGAALDQWNAGDMFSVPARENELRIGAAGRPYGARLAFETAEATKAIRGLLRGLRQRQRQEAGRQLRIIGLSTAALVSLVVAFVVGVPLLARNVTAVLPPEWETALGDEVAVQMEEALSEGVGLQLCDPDPNSIANRAIARFARQAVEGTGTPFVPDIKVVRSDFANAFALPGGRSYYFSGLLEQTRTADEFAGVMAHELGHVVHRHSMEGLVSSSATGLLIGFILGDLTGSASIAGGLGVAVLDSSFSRDAEREADRFAGSVAQRMAFEPAAMAHMLNRIVADRPEDQTLALLSTHPLTTERLEALEAVSVENVDLPRPFTDAEWQAIKSMCLRPWQRPTSVPTNSKTDRG